MSYFWQEKTLNELNQSEWEQLCDGCAKCCLHKIEDEDSGIIYSTDVVCQYLDSELCRCKNYAQRSQLEPECVSLTSHNLQQVYFMPATCSYRLIAEGKPLPSWHPLLTGNKESTHESGHSVRGKVVSDVAPDDLIYHITSEWD